ncbi:adenylate kinase [Kitasatospora herbaricolor]|uniref:Adenylate kinase n=1 Tax=Kitasatospora herbaricolor TaxID=68217 RepID=A0ABZ1WGI1_9ACTN|nr:adenylate kinase [Kitasatospora herbaricolor]
MRIVLVGPPGAGKGTQAQVLAQTLSIPHISTGDLFRANIGQGTGLGIKAKAYMNEGRLVPDEVTIAMAKDRMLQADTAGGFLLDGFPRNLGQARVLDEFLAQRGIALDGVLDLEVPDKEVVDRIAGRRLCRNDGNHMYHVAYNPPQQDDVCDECGSGLYKRPDDAEAKVRTRLEVYHTETEPITDYYAQQDLLLTIPALGKVDEVTARAIAALEKNRHA